LPDLGHFTGFLEQICADPAQVSAIAAVEIASAAQHRGAPLFKSRGSCAAIPTPAVDESDDILEAAQSTEIRKSKETFRG